MVTNVTKVTDTEGTVHEFGEKAKVKKQSYVSEDGSAVTKFVFRNGEVRRHVTPRDSAIFGRLAVHGADQKFGDEFAGLDDVEDMVEAFEQMSARLGRGEWSEKRVSEGLAGASLLARALAQIKNAPIAQVKEELAGVAPEVKKALARQSKVAATIAQLKAEREARKAEKGKPTVNADAALAEFLSA